jgi:hypothetical protein
MAGDAPLPGHLPGDLDAAEVSWPPATVARCGDPQGEDRDPMLL